MWRCYDGGRNTIELAIPSCVSSGAEESIDVLFANLIYRDINNLPYSVERARSRIRRISDCAVCFNLAGFSCVLQTAMKRCVIPRAILWRLLQGKFIAHVVTDGVPGADKLRGEITSRSASAAEVIQPSIIALTENKRSAKSTNSKSAVANPAKRLGPVSDKRSGIGVFACDPERSSPQHHVFRVASRPFQHSIPILKIQIDARCRLGPVQEEDRQRSFSPLARI